MQILNLKTITTLLILFLLTGPLSAQLLNRHFQDLEQAFHIGEAKQIPKIFKKISSKVRNKKLEVRDSILYLMAISRFNRWEGKVEAAEEFASRYLEMTKINFGENSAIYLTILSKRARIALEAGDHQICRNAMMDFFQLNRQYLSADSEMVFQARLIQTRNAVEMGNFGEASRFIENLLFKAENRLQEKVEETNSRGKVRFVKISDEELDKRNHEWLGAKVLKLQLLRERGDLKEAAAEMENIANFCVYKNLRNEDQAYLDFWLEKARCHNHLRQNELAVEILRRGMTWFSRRDGPNIYTKTHPRYLQFLEELFAYYLQDDEADRANDYANALRKVLKSRFPENPENLTRLKIPLPSEMEGNDNSLIAKIRLLIHDIRKYRMPGRYALTLYDKLIEKGLQRDSLPLAENMHLEKVSFTRDYYGTESVFFHSAACNLAEFYLQNTNKAASTEAIFTSSLHNGLIPQLSEKSPVLIRALNAEALSFELKGQFQHALNIYLRSLIALQGSSKKEHFESAVQTFKVGNMELNLGEFAAAEKSLQEALEVILEEKKEKSQERVDCERLLARLYIMTGRFEEAEKHLYRSIRFAKRNKEASLFEFNGMDDEIALLLHKGLFSEAQEKSDELIKKRIQMVSSNIHPSLILPYQLSAQVYTALGQYGKSEALALQAIDASRKMAGDTNILYLRGLGILSRIHRSFGDYDRSLEAAKKCLQGISMYFGDMHAEAAQPLTDIALVLLQKGAEKSEVQNYLEKAAAIVKKHYGDKNPLYAESLQYLASFYIKTKQWPKATAFLNEAENIWEERLGSKNIHSAEILVMRSDVNLAMNEISDARNSLEKAAAIYKDVFSDIHPRYLEILPRIAQCYFMQNKPEKALDIARESVKQNFAFVSLFFPSMAEREKARLWTSIKTGFDFFTSIATKFASEKPELTSELYNVILKTKSILLSSSIQVRERILNSEDRELKEKYRAWIKKKEEITAAIDMGVEPRRLAGIDLRKMEADADNLEAQLSKLSSDFSKAKKEAAVDWKQVKAGLSRDERAIEILRFQHFGRSFTDSVIYAALILDNLPESKPRMVLFPEGSRMEGSYIRYYRKSVRLGLPDTLSYRIFWKPLEPFINVSGKIYFSPDGVYNELNPEGFLRPDGKFVIEEKKIVFIASTRELIRKSGTIRASASENNTAYVFGNPAYYSEKQLRNEQKIEYLPGTAEEARKIEQILKENSWQVSTFTDARASETQLKRVKMPRVLHIATHGYFRESPRAYFKESAFSILNKNSFVDNPLLRSGLYLTDAGMVLDTLDDDDVFQTGDGIFSSLEAMNLNLNVTELVVLSACETGRGDVQVGEGVYGLHRSFQIAGSDAVIMSLFKVSDEATQQLMDLFYRNWIQNGASIRTAFTEAKLELKKKFPLPIYWASFILIGAP